MLILVEFDKVKKTSKLALTDKVLNGIFNEHLPD